MRVRSSIGFRKWIELETKKQSFIEAAENDDFPQKVFVYLSAAFDTPFKEGQGWENAVRSIQKAHEQNSVEIYIPIIKDAPKSGKEIDWNYSGRDWHYYSHILSQAYGWTLEYIGNLDVNTAFAHIQEVLTDEQVEKEFTHGLSEVAYRYNKSTKKSEYVPLKRPYWMRAATPQTIKKVVIRADMIPVGNIQHVSGLPEEYQFKEYETNKAKKTKPDRDTQTLSSP